MAHEITKTDEIAQSELEPTESAAPQSEVVLPLSDDERAASAQVQEHKASEARNIIDQIFDKKAA